MNPRSKWWLLAPVLLAPVLLVGCATVPTDPSVMALPGTGRSFDEFRGDDASCRDYAFYQIGGRAREQSINNAAVGSAVVGTAVGALAGAAMGGHSGAGVGAGMGLIVGSASGAQSTQYSGLGRQRRFDNAYVQCMYARGHRVPVAGHYAMPPRAATAPQYVAPPADNVPPPPPAGMPPPPPPR